MKRKTLKSKTQELDIGHLITSIFLIVLFCLNIYNVIQISDLKTRISATSDLTLRERSIQISFDERLNELEKVNVLPVYLEDFNDVFICEGDKITILPKVTGNIRFINFTYTELFTPQENTMSAAWQTIVGDAGVYLINVTVRNSKFEDTSLFVLRVYSEKECINDKLPNFQ